MRLWVAAAFALALFALAVSARLGAFIECRAHDFSLMYCIVVTG